MAVLVVAAATVPLDRLLPGSDTSDYESALIDFNAGRYKEAIVALKSVLGTHPSDLSSHVLIGRAYLALGYAELAEEELRRARALGAHPSVVDVALAQAFLQQGKYTALFAEPPTEGHGPALRADLLVVHGQAHLRLRQLDRAAQRFDDALALRPEDISALIGRARVQLHRGHIDQALEQARAVAERFPASAEAWFAMGEAHRAHGNRDAALDAFGRALERDPTHLPARLARAAILVDDDRDDEALAELDRVRAVRPDDPSGNYLQALVAAKRGDDAQADRLIDRAGLGLMRASTGFVMRDPPSLLLLGVIHYRGGRLEDAYQVLSQFVTLDPYHAGARKLLGRLQLDRGAPYDAVMTLEPLVRTRPEDAEALALLSQAYGRSGRPVDAAALLARAAALVPKRDAFRSQLALTHLALGPDAEAVRELESALALDGDDAQAGALLGLLQLWQRDFDGALATASALIERDPESAAAHNLAGVVHLAREDQPAARASFEHAVAARPEFLAAHHNLARMALREHDFEAAKARFAEILRIAPDDVRAMVELAALARRADDDGAAIDWLERARAVDPDLPAPQIDLAELYLRRGDREASQRIVAELEERFPGDAGVRVARARLELAAGDVGDAMATFRELSVASGVSSARLLQFAKYQRITGDRAGARTSLERALRGDPRFLPAKIALVELDLAEDDVVGALRRAEATVADHPDAAAAGQLLGDVLMRLGRPDEAEPAYARALRRQATPDLVLRHYRARHARGDGAEAIGELELWVSEHPNDLDASRALAAALLEVGRVDDALTAHERLRERLPDDPIVLTNLAALYVDRDDPRGLEIARRAHELAPAEAATHHALGWALVRSGQLEVGLHHLREAEHRSPANPSIRYHVAVALERLGRRDEARAELERALADASSFAEVDQARDLLARMRAR